MRKRLIVVGLLTFLSFASVYSVPTYAGHSVAGTYCQCGCPGCIPDPDEECGLCGQSLIGSPVADTQPDSLPADSIPDFSPEVMLGLLMALLVLRINRA